MDLRAFCAKDVLFFVDNINERVFLIVALTRITMQVDSVGMQCLYGIRPYMDREALPENPEPSAPSPADQGEPVEIGDMLADNVTLDQLLASDLSPTVELVPETDGDNVYALSEEVLRDGVIWNAAVRTLIYERDRRNAAVQSAFESGQHKVVANEKIDDLLGSVNALLKDAELTNERVEALKIFNSTLEQLKDSFDPFVYDFRGTLIGYSTDVFFAELQSAFDDLSNAFNSHKGPTLALKHELETVFSTKFGQLQNGLEDVLGVRDLTEEDIFSIAAKFIGTYAETEERAMKDQQIVRDSMPEIIEMIKKFMPDFNVAE